MKFYWKRAEGNIYIEVFFKWAQRALFKKVGFKNKIENSWSLKCSILNNVVSKIKLKTKGVLKMNKKNQHVTPHPNGGWQVKGAGNSRATVRSETQAAAITKATQVAKNQRSEVIIHRPNGQIRDKNSYGNDPFPPRG